MYFSIRCMWNMTTFVLFSCGLCVLRFSVMSELEEKVTSGDSPPPGKKAFSDTVKPSFRAQLQLHLRVLSLKTVFHTKLHYYLIQIRRSPFDFMKLSNNGHVGLEIETDYIFLSLASFTKFMSKLCLYDTYWEYELLLFSTCDLHCTHYSWGTQFDCSNTLL